MIAPILNREFVLQQLREIKSGLAALFADFERRAALPKQYPEISPEDVKAARQLIEEAEAHEAERSSGQVGFEPPPPERRGQVPAPIDDFSFFSRDPVISNIQSALEAYFEEAQPQQIEEAELPDDRRRGPSDDVAVTERTLAGVQLRREVDGRRVFDQFSVTDVRWISCLFAMGIRQFRSKRQFNPNPATPVPIGDRARVVLVSDWGTGLPRAQKVATEIRKVLDQGKAENLEQHVVHLGDVYYSGWKREYEKRFLGYWPVPPSEADSIGSWSLNGNHDMYSGGHGYYDFLLRDPRFRRHEQSSFFRLFNRHWQILGLDTAWDDGGLKDPQAAWVEAQASASGVQTILLSHHQLFSAYEKPSWTLREKLKNLIEADRIHGWFWGHEHRCILFKPYDHVPCGRLIGYGGTPVYMWHEQTDPVPLPGEYEYRAYLQKGLERWALFGFAVLDFAGPTIRVRYIDENGLEHKREVIGLEAVAPNMSAPRPAVESPTLGDWYRKLRDRFSATRVEPPAEVMEARVPSTRAKPPAGGAAPAPTVTRPSAARDAGAESTGASGIDFDAVAAALSLRRTPHMDASPGGPLRPGALLQVSVYADKETARPGEEAEEIVIEAPPELLRFDIQVWLVGTGHFAILGEALKVLVIDRVKDTSEAVVFQVKVNETISDTSEAALTAYFTYKGRPCGRVRRTVEIRLRERDLAPPTKPEAAVRATTISRSAKPPRAAALRVDVLAAEPDLTVEIRDPEKTLQHLTCLVRTRLLAEYERGACQPWHLPAVTSAIVSQYMERFTAPKLSPEQRIASLKGAGIRLFEAAPPVFRKVFWALIDAKKPLKTIYIVSEEPYIPWELMVPNRKLPNLTNEEREALGVEFAVGRWTPKTQEEDANISPPQRIRLRDSLVIAPQYSGNKVLKHAPAEADYVCQHFPGRKITPAEFDQIDRDLKDKGVSLLHFVCHGSSKVVVQEIYLESDQTLDSDQILAMEGFKSACSSKRPLVFMNACEVGRQVPALVGVGGFAPSFIDLGASGVVAPLWSVKDDIAYNVAKEFYEIVLSDGFRYHFAEALQEIRKKAYDPNVAEDSYAAYTFYGDPWASRQNP
jgi:hypothetical protein